MLKKNFIESYHNRLDILYENKILSEEKLAHFKKREVPFYDTDKDLNCSNLSKILPYIVIGASNE